MKREEKQLANSARLRGGPGVYVRSTPDGSTVSFDVAAALWLHPFRVSLVGNAATVRPGFVNGISVTIDGQPLEGSDDDPTAPRVEWDELKLDTKNRGFIALELSFSFKDWSIQKIEVVQVAYLHSDDGTDPPPETGGLPSFGGTPTLKGRRCRHPLAMLRVRASSRVSLYQNTYFDLSHRVDARKLGDGTPSDFGRHFFWPV